jgi:hypothetical protein
MAREPFYFSVDPATPPRPCDRCPATIYFVRTTSGKRMPVRVDLPGCYPPVGPSPGRGLSHFADCPGADAMRKKR